MIGTKPPHIETVTEYGRLCEIVSHASKQSIVAVDLESNGFFRYPEQVCLIQLGIGDLIFLIDPFAVENLHPIGGLLQDLSVQKVLHSADYDLRSLDRDYGFRVRNIFDTSIGAAFLGLTSLGLAAVLNENLGVQIGKSKRIQRSDWSIRPLSSVKQNYAAQDVHHLIPLSILMKKRLFSLDRLDWVSEECERLEAVKYKRPDKEWAFTSVKGSRNLDGLGLSILRELYRFREKEAVKINRPPFKIISDSVILEIASSPNSDFTQIKGVGRFGRSPASSGVRKSILAGLRFGSVEYPSNQTSIGPRFGKSKRDNVKQRLKYLKSWRSSVALDLGLAPPLLWPAVSLERISSKPRSLIQEIHRSDVRMWQRREFSESLIEFANGLC